MEKRIWTRILACMLVVSMFIITGITCVSAESVEKTNKSPLALDVVIVLDQSNSMKTNNGGSDPTGLRFDAAAIMLSMCDVEYSRAAIIEFAEDATVVEPLRSIRYTQGASSSRNEMIKKLESERAKDPSPATNIGKAVAKAVDVLKDGGNIGNQQVILLLTDGAIDMLRGGDNPNDTARKNRESENALKSAAEEAAKLGIKIHTIQLTDPNAKNVNTELVSKAVSMTGGEFKRAQEAKDLPGVFNSIFAQEIGASIMYFVSEPVANEPNKQQLNIKVPNQSVSEVNIMLPLMGIKKDSVKLYNPHGKEAGDAVYSATTKYSQVFKIIKPSESEVGNWQLVFENNTNSSTGISVQVVYSYSARPVIQAKSALDKTEELNLVVKYMEDKQSVNDKAMYNISATYKVLDKDGSAVKSGTLTANKDELQYEKTFRLEEFDTEKREGEYTIQVHVEGDGLKRDAEPIKIAFIGKAPSVSHNKQPISIDIKDPAYAETWSNEKEIETINLNDYIIDIDGDKLVYSVVSAPEGITHKQDESKISINRTLIPLEGTVVIQATDIDGKTCQFSIPVNVYDKSNIYTGFSAAIEPLKKKIDKNESYEIRLMIKDDKKKTDGESNHDVNDRIPETIALDVNRNGEISKTQLIWNTDERCYIGEIATGNKVETIQLNGSITVGKYGNVVIPIDLYTIEVKNNAPESLVESSLNERKEIPNVFWVAPGLKATTENTSKEIVISLKNLFRDVDNEQLQYEQPVVTKGNKGTDDCEAKIENETLHINAKEVGEYTIIVSAVDGDGARAEIKGIISAECKYDSYSAKLVVVLPEEQESFGKGQNQKIVATVYDNENKQVMTDENLPESIKVLVTEIQDESTILDNDKADIEIITLKWNTESGQYESIWNTGNKETGYKFEAETSLPLNGGVKEVHIEPCEADVTNMPIEIVGELKDSVEGKLSTYPLIKEKIFWINELPILFKKTQDIDVRVHDLLYDPDETPTYEITTIDNKTGNLIEPGVAQLMTNEENETIVHIEPSQEGKYRVSLVCTDNDGNSKKTEVDFSVYSLKKYVPLAALALLIVLFIIIQIIKAIYWAGQPKYGKMSIVRTKDGRACAAPKKSLPTSGRSSKKTMSLKAIICSGQTGVIAPEKAAKITIRPSKQSNTLVLKNGLSDKSVIVKVAGVTVDNGKTKSWPVGTDLTLQPQNNTACIGFKLENSANGPAVPGATSTKKSTGF